MLLEEDWGLDDAELKRLKELYESGRKKRRNRGLYAEYEKGNDDGDGEVKAMLGRLLSASDDEEKKDKKEEEKGFIPGAPGFGAIVHVRKIEGEMCDVCSESCF